MTREEAIKGLTSLVEVRRKYVGMQTMKDEIECLDMAIKALEQEPCEDCISREQAKTAIRDRFKDLPSRVEINTILNDLPSVTPQPKVGHWKRVELGLFDSVSIRWECSECKKSDKFRSNFCFNCGAKMESEVQDADSN